MIPLSDSHPAGKFPFWTMVLIAINSFVFFLQITAPDFEAFVYQYALIPANVDLSNLATLMPFITSQFLHGDFLHIISNMLFLWVFGDNVEAKLGNIFFPIFYLAAGVAAGLAQYFFSPGSQIPMIGASGAVAGVLGAYFAWFPHHTVRTLIPTFGFLQIVNIPASFMLLYWFAIQIFSSVFSFGSSEDVGGVAFFAHIGGFVFGWIIAKFLPINHKQPDLLEAIS